MFNLPRWLDNLLSIERQQRTSGHYLIALLIVAFILGAISHQIWLSFAPEATPNSTSAKRKLQAQLQQQATTLASRNLALSIEQEANKNLQAMFSDQLVRQKELEKELAFYRSLMVPNQEVEGVVIHTVELAPAMLPKQQHLKVILTQLNKRKTNLKVNLDAELIGSQGNEVTQYKLSQLNKQKYTLDFKYFDVFETDFSLPDGFNLQRIKIKLVVKSARGIKGGEIEQVFSIADITSDLTNDKNDSSIILEQTTQVLDNPEQ